MRRWIALAAVWAFGPGAAWGQTAPAMGRLAAQSGWTTFAVVGGRLAVVDTPPRLERRAEWSDPQEEISEAICIRSVGGATAVHYEFASPRERLTVEAVGSQWVEIHRAPQEGESPVEWRLVQPPGTGRDLVLTIGAGPSRREFSAPTFWRLVLAEPDVFRDCVAPVLERLRPDWPLQQQAGQIEDRLLELAARAPSPEVQRWQTLVDQLAEPHFARREAADRELRAIGQPLLPFLRELDRRRLDAEQRMRLGRIQQSLNEAGEDTPGRVASQLLYDQATWLILMTREDAVRRAAAARHFCKICPEAAAFDPQADQAVRRAQLQQLRRQLARD